MGKPRTTQQQIAAMATVLAETYLIKILEDGFNPSEHFFKHCGFTWVHERLALGIPGIYAIYASESKTFNLATASCLYVGKSNGLRGRLAHHSAWMKVVAEDFSSMGVCYKVIDLPGLDCSENNRELLLAESMFIGLLRPAFNFSQPSSIFASNPVRTVWESSD